MREMKQKVLVISTYPPRGSVYGNAFSAVASYCRNTLQAIIDVTDEFEFEVLADVLGEEEAYEEEGVRVVRCWRRNSVKSMMRLLGEVIKRKEVNKVLVEVEWSMLGNNKLMLGWLLMLIGMMRLWGRKVYVVSHGVLLDAALVAAQLGLKPKAVKTKILSGGMRCFYWCLVKTAEKVVVFEEKFRLDLVNLTGDKGKIVTIPHGVDISLKKGNGRRLRRKMGIGNDEKVLVCFGFLNWYKGSDWLVREMAQVLKGKGVKVRLVMAGGESRVHGDDPVYRKMVEDIYRDAETDSRIRVTGFIDEEQMADYFEMADLVIVPYRVMLSSSGPLSLAFSCGRPVVISEKLRGYWESWDFRQGAEESGLSKYELFFGFSSEGLDEVIKSICTSSKKLEKLEKFSKLMREKRSWKVVGAKYAKVLE